MWRHIERDSVSNHRCLYRLLNRLFRCRSKKISKLRVSGLRAGNSPMTGSRLYRQSTARGYYTAYINNVYVGALCHGAKSSAYSKLWDPFIYSYGYNYFALKHIIVILRSSMANTISLLSGWMLRCLMSIILLAPLMRHDLCTFICGNVHLSDQNPVESLFANVLVNKKQGSVSI